MRALFSTMLCAALLLGACKSSPETKGDAAPPEGDGAKTGEGAKTGDEAKAGDTANAGDQTGRGALAAGALNNLLLPPKEPGTSRFAVAGCAATPDVEPPATRALPAADTVQTSALEGGVLLSHEVAHACCLSATSSVAVEGTKVVVTETLSGKPCRCRCSSNLRTSVGLKPGKWQVEVKTVEPGRSWTAWTGELSVVK